MTEFGVLSLWMALLMAVWSVGVGAAGGMLRRTDLLDSAGRARSASAAFAALAVSSLAWLLASGAFNVRYVALHTSEELGTVYRVASLAAGREGQLVLWSVAFSLCIAIALRRSAIAQRQGIWQAALFLGAIVVTLLALTTGAAPFRLLDFVPAGGRGLDPRFERWTRILDPPALAIGCAASIIALTLAAMSRERGGSAGDRRAAAGAWPLAACAAMAIVVGMRIWSASAASGEPPATLAILGTAPRAAWLALIATTVALAILLGIPHKRTAARVAGTGMVFAVIGLGAQWRAKEYRAMLGDGATFRASDSWGAEWTFTSQGASRIERPTFLLTALALAPTRAGVQQPYMRTELREYGDPPERAPFPADTVPAMRRGLSQDVYVVARGVGAASAEVTIRFAPLVWFIWIGGALVLVGGIVAFWPLGVDQEVQS